MNYPAAELRGIKLPMTSFPWKRESREQTDWIPDPRLQHTGTVGNDGQRSRSLTPMQSIEEFF